MQCFKLVFVFAILFLPDLAPASEKAAKVKTWATKLGNELWRLSESLTKSDKIKMKYKAMNASVKKKDGNAILESALRSVSTMLTRKINAVKCIHDTAVKLAQEFNYSDIDANFTYCSAKYSEFHFEDSTSSSQEGFPSFAVNNPHYIGVDLEKDSHFYNISVDTSQSCVHVPTNIYYKEKGALNAILWSEGLNEIFIKNYNSDPSLVWQYFGSSYGILRFFPAMPWKLQTIEVDDYDCRVRPWYIEAATCSKDVIILFDVSGSMTGFKNYVARRTLKALLDTLSNNDYVNVYTFKNETKEVVHCFVDLVQATKENLASITRTLEPTDGSKKHNVPLEGYANLTIAFTKAFTTLKPRRSQCMVNSSQGCNQLVMLITDYVPSNLSNVFEEYNRERVGDKVYTPVRVFTYLIGKEVTNVQEIKEMACSNRGYFAHIHSVEEVQQQVLKYINVIARPMILQGEKPPPTWTHANIDDTRTSRWKVSTDESKPDEDKLVTSVAIPAFDNNRYNSEDKDDAILLGVAGTDVPIDSIAKLAQPHQLGVNGYSFIVSNNGYLLLHPLLVTSVNGQLQENYNSVDFVEVEQVDDGKGARELGDKIKLLRQQLIDGVHDSMTKVEILYHYDNMRRIARVEHDYFFNALEGTPFSMGISLPRIYGDTELLLQDNPLEAKQGMELTGINVTEYFKYNYRVHPDWVYCKYHYLEGHETPNAEVETWNFLVNISHNKIDITKKQYNEEGPTADFKVETHCGNAKTQLGKDDYYCNEDLIKQLIFDAKLSKPYFEEWQAKNAEERRLVEKYNVSVRFIATGSGLTRWHYIFDDDKNEKVDERGNRHRNNSESVFGDHYYNAIEETWYKAAVLQHMIDEESLVIATSLPVLDKTINIVNKDADEDGDKKYTASYAIFYKDNQIATPASVVGFQFSYKSFIQIFLDLTKSRHNNLKDFSCDSSAYKCYVIDSSGYIVLSREQDEVGRFFGVKNPYVLQNLINKGIFSYVEVFNYQALCSPSSLQQISKSWSLTTPFSLAGGLVKWLITELILLLSNWNNFAFSAPIESEDDYLDLINNVYTSESETTTTTPLDNNTSKAEEPAQEAKEELFSCDHQIYLYILNQTFFLPSKSKEESKEPYPVVFEDNSGKCYPPYWAALIPKTNLLLIVVDDDPHENPSFENCEKPIDTEPRMTVNSTTSREPCHKLDLGMLKRRRLEGCFTYHEGERNITACGRGHLMKLEMMLLLAAIVIAKLVNSFQF